MPEKENVIVPLEDKHVEGCCFGVDLGTGVVDELSNTVRVECIAAINKIFKDGWFFKYEKIFCEFLDEGREACPVNGRDIKVSGGRDFKIKVFSDKEDVYVGSSRTEEAEFDEGRRLKLSEENLKRCPLSDEMRRIYNNIKVIDENELEIGCREVIRTGDNTICRKRAGEKKCVVNGRTLERKNGKEGWKIVIKKSSF